MIRYSAGPCNGTLSWRTVRTLASSSFVRSAVAVSIIFGCWGALLRAIALYSEEGSLTHRLFVANLSDDGLYKVFSSFCGFLIVFRASHSISRYFNGADFCLAFTGIWFNAASSLFSFCRGSKASCKDADAFQHTFIRLVSLLVAVAFTELSGESQTPSIFELLDVNGIDKITLNVIQSSECRVETIYQMIQSLVAANIANGVLCMPPPILSRAFQEMGNAMFTFHQALKFIYFPMPYPYVVVVEIFLLIHGFFSAHVIASLWTKSSPLWSFFWTFVVVFMFRFVNGLSMELDNPFGQDDNDINVTGLHSELNNRLIALLRVHDVQTPTLGSNAVLGVEDLQRRDPATTRALVVTCLEEIGDTEIMEECGMIEHDAVEREKSTERQVMFAMLPTISVSNLAKDNAKSRRALQSDKAKVSVANLAAARASRRYRQSCLEPDQVVAPNIGLDSTQLVDLGNEPEADLGFPRECEKKAQWPPNATTYGMPQCKSPQENPPCTNDAIIDLNYT